MDIVNYLKKHKNTLLVIAFFIFIGIFCFLFFYNRPELLKDPYALKTLIEGYGHFSILVFLCLQILQIVFFVIPGEIFQIVAGYIFGPFLGFALCLIGSIIGGTINFYIARIAGRHYIEKLVTEKNNWLFDKINKFNGKPNFEKRASRDIFILYLIPGMPKDVLGYVAGVTEIRYIHYIIASNLGKMPALFLSTFFGGNFFTVFSLFKGV
ncbi:MAG: hypothetical protein BKP49_01615 [Treponema sp. CETP13]|nr:MAG: hypothetical protein BKP49_01615 [Treponema sp. CETP13]